MRDELWARYHAFLRRVRRFERREIHEFGRWIEHTNNLLHLSVLLFVPLLIALVTLLSNSMPELSFLLFPPLASGTYTLFSDPEGPYSSPRTFVGGMTAGAVCGWLAVEVVTGIYGADPATLRVDAAGAALAIFLTGVVTWVLDLEEPMAFSTALLTLVAGTTEGGLFAANGQGEGTSAFLYVLSVALSSSLIASVFLVWRGRFYDRRARYLYQSTQGDDHVLVPIRGESSETTAMFAARLAAAHDAGKVVLLDVVDQQSIADAEAQLGDERGGVVEPEEGGPKAADTGELAAEQVGEEAGRNLERLASRIRTKVGVPCEVVVAATETNEASAVLTATQENNCDLVVTPYEVEYGHLSPFTRKLLRGDVDVIAFRPTREATRWRRILVPVRKAGDVAHAMIDFASRLSGPTGSVGVCHCIARADQRRPAESMLANLVETFDAPIETRVSRSSIEHFLDANASAYDLVVMGASTDRSTASRLISPPTFERLHELDCDVAIVHRA